MSTIWLARRCAAVVSIERDEGWFRTVSEHLRKERLTNVDLRLVDVPVGDGASYSDALSDLAGHRFELALIDGNRRDSAMEVAIALVEPGGYIFLDNTDMPREDYEIAERMLLDAAGEGAEIRVFNDVCPGLVMVNEAKLVRV